MNNIIVQDRKDQFAEIVTMIQHARNEVVRLAKDRQIDSALYERNVVGTPKLSPVMREIAPQADRYAYLIKPNYRENFVRFKNL